MEWAQLITGGVAGGVVAAVASIIGQKIKSSTAIKLSSTDDRSKHNKDLMEQVDSLWKRLKEYENHVQYFRLRDAIFYNAFAQIGGELRLMNGQLATHLHELKAVNVDLPECIAQAEYIKQTVEGINKIITETEVKLTNVKTS